MVLLRCAFLINDNQPTPLEEKKKSETNQNIIQDSPNLDKVIQNRVNQISERSLKDRIDMHQLFFKFYGKNN